MKSTLKSVWDYIKWCYRGKLGAWWFGFSCGLMFAGLAAWQLKTRAIAVRFGIMFGLEFYAVGIALFLIY